LDGKRQCNSDADSVCYADSIFNSDTNGDADSLCNADSLRNADTVCNTNA
jgi:hypothetical protein